jgi:hypothetical protein
MPYDKNGYIKIVGFSISILLTSGFILIKKPENGHQILNVIHGSSINKKEFIICSEPNSETCTTIGYYVCNIITKYGSPTYKPKDTVPLSQVENILSYNSND